MFPFYVFIFLHRNIWKFLYCPMAGTEKPFYEMNFSVTITDGVHVDLAGTVAPKFARLPPTRRHSQYATVISLWWLERRALCGSTKRVLYPKWTYDCFDSHPVSSWGRIFWSYGFLHPSEFDQFDHGLVKLFIFFCLKLGWSRVFTKYLRLVMFRGGTWSTIGAIFFWSASHERNSIPRTL